MAEAAVLAWVRGPHTVWKALRCASARCSVRDVIYRHCQEQEIPEECFFVKCNGVLVAAGDEVQHGAVYSLGPRLLGRKGDFGSMLRALGDNQSRSLRDLSRRRLQDVNHEKAMAQWVKPQAERARGEGKLVEPAHCFTSPDYRRQCHEMVERLQNSSKVCRLPPARRYQQKSLRLENGLTSQKWTRELVQRKGNAFDWAWKD